MRRFDAFHYRNYQCRRSGSCADNRYRLDRRQLQVVQKCVHSWSLGGARYCVCR
ncbi:MAG: DUF434 domain-containing protein [Planctomycetaceae bacterium]|nr:DUF434 domain-containing protein [Planctomycetaceae bacterium]